MFEVLQNRHLGHAEAILEVGAACPSGDLDGTPNGVMPESGLENQYTFQLSLPENPSVIEDIRKQAKTQGGPRRYFLLAISRKCQMWVLNRSGGRVAGMIVERSGIELFAAFPLTTGINSIAIFMRVLRRFGSEPNASEA